MGRDSSELRGRVLFLVGARRSGTNWLHGLLTLHPRLVKVPSETHLLYTLSELAPRFQHGLVGSANTGAIFLPREDMLDGFRDLCDRAFAHQMRVYGGPDQSWSNGHRCMRSIWRWSAASIRMLMSSI